MTTDEQPRNSYSQSLATAARLLGASLEPYLAPTVGEPANAADFKRIATIQAFGDSWSRSDLLDNRSRALVSIAATASIGAHEPLRGQVRIGINAGLTPTEVVEVFIHLAAYVGVARAFECYAVASEVFAERQSSLHATAGETE